MTLTKLRFAAMFLATAMLAAGAVMAGSKDAPVSENDKPTVSATQGTECPPSRSLPSSK